MQCLIEALQQSVLPVVSRLEGDIVPSGGAGVVVGSNDFIEAYPYATERHGYFEWFWLLSGQATMKIDGRVYSMAPGDFCFLPPLLAHADVYNASTPAYQSLWFSCSPESVGCHLFSYQPVGDWEVLAYCVALRQSETWSVAQALHRELSGQEPLRNEAVRGLLLQLAAHLGRALRSVGEGDSHSFYTGPASRRVMDYLCAHYAEDVALADVAEAVFLSPHYLTSIFKKETGKTIFDALTEIRIAHARRLIVENRLPLHEVARAVGFKSPHHFSRVFRRVEGVPPSHFRK